MEGFAFGGKDGEEDVIDYPAVTVVCDCFLGVFKTAFCHDRFNFPHLRHPSHTVSPRVFLEVLATTLALLI